MSQIKYLILLLSLFIPQFLLGEIRSVTLKWNSGLCPEACINLLKKQFQEIKGIASTSFHQESGEANIRWVPTESFSFRPINIATRMVGIRVDTTIIEVRGMITSSGNNYKLVSIGDGTSFQLIGEKEVIPGRYVPRASLATHPLPEATKKKLDEAQEKKLLVTIRGPLFEPERYLSSLYLIVQSLSVEEQQQ